MEHLRRSALFFPVTLPRGAPRSGAVALAVCLLGLACAPLTQEVRPDEMLGTGRHRVIEALRSPAVTGGMISTSGLASTALSSGKISVNRPIKGLDPAGTPGARPFRQVLEDGTVVEGLLFPYEDGTGNPKPLLMASFGFLQDRWGSEAAKFHELYLRDPSVRIPAHVLILDHPTAGPFLANNGFLSIGAYDDARMWIEIAKRLRDELQPSGVHLFGVSMSGQTVVHALIEDTRLGLGLFQSAMAISLAPDFQQAPGRQLARLPVPEGHRNPWQVDGHSDAGNTIVDAIQGWGIRVLLAKQFFPHYAVVRPNGPELQLEPEAVAEFLRGACEDRIAFLRANRPKTWNQDFGLADLETFMASARIAEVINRARTPLVLVSAFDDPAVDRWMYVEAATAAVGNPWVLSYETEQGGHFGFDVAYGGDYLGKLIRLMSDPEVLQNWKDMP